MCRETFSTPTITIKIAFEQDGVSTTKRYDVHKVPLIRYSDYFRAAFKTDRFVKGQNDEVSELSNLDRITP